MPSEDAIRWNDRYQLGEEHGWTKAPRPFLVENASILPTSGLALDAAMGLGESAGFLLDRGLRVVGVDISSEAVWRARQKFPALMALVADLSTYRFPDHCFNLIVNFYFLDRELAREYRRLLKPSGILVMETLTQEMLKRKPEISPEYLLKPGELRELFDGWEILAYREGWYPASNDRRKAIAGIVARLSE